MKIVIANGRHEADFMIKKFKQDNHKLVVINSDLEFGKYISSSNHIPVLNGDTTKSYTLEDAGIHDADVLISLSSDDIENYVTCVTAKKIFNVKRTVSVVRNPKRVDLFKQLGIDSVICSTYLLGESIKYETLVESITKTLSLENDKIVITEIQIDQEFSIANKIIKNIDFPPRINISCIFRDPDVIIPNGNSEIKPGDKLIIVSTPDEQENITEFIKNKADNNEE
ncbi:MAG: TrkA family potassium uptake protein [Candidatus Izimaplasma sp.]|nr:TrkA family potassium uptake protein [Candidatus Izimaplasma bacterium]